LLEKDNFKGLNGWIDNFKKWYNLKQYNIYSKAASMLLENLNMMQENLCQKLRNYSLKDIFNYNEMDLFWKIKFSHIISNEPVSEIKQSKECVIILFTYNTIGNEKLSLLFIYKYENSWALKNINNILSRLLLESKKLNTSVNLK